MNKFFDKEKYTGSRLRALGEADMVQTSPKTKKEASLLHDLFDKWERHWWDDVIPTLKSTGVFWQATVNKATFPPPTRCIAYAAFPVYRICIPWVRIPNQPHPTTPP